MMSNDLISIGVGCWDSLPAVLPVRVNRVSK